MNGTYSIYAEVLGSETVADIYTKQSVKADNSMWAIILAIVIILLIMTSLTLVMLKRGERNGRKRNQ